MRVAAGAIAKKYLRERLGVIVRGYVHQIGPVRARQVDWAAVEDNPDLAHALMSINAVKGVEIGDGFAVIEQHGSEHRDEITPEGFLSNHAGGVLGGISTGIAEAMTALVLMDHWLRHRAQNAEVKSATPVVPPQPGH